MAHPLSNKIAELKKIANKIRRLRDEVTREIDKKILDQAMENVKSVSNSLQDDVSDYYKQCLKQEYNDNHN